MRAVSAHGFPGQEHSGDTKNPVSVE